MGHEKSNVLFYLRTLDYCSADGACPINSVRHLARHECSVLFCRIAYGTLDETPKDTLACGQHNEARGTRDFVQYTLINQGINVPFRM